MLSALSQSTLSNSNNDTNSSTGPRPQSPSQKSVPSSVVKTEPDHDIHPLEMESHPQQQAPPSFNDLSPSSSGIPSSSSSITRLPMNNFDGRMDYSDESPVHPFSMPLQQQQQPQPPASSAQQQQQQQQHQQQHQQLQQQEPQGSPRQDQEAFNPPYTSAQPQQHQQLLKLKTEHGVSSPTSVPTTTSTTTVNTPDIIMTHDEDDSLQDGSSSETERDDHPSNSYRHQNQEDRDDTDQSPHSSLQHPHQRTHLVVDTSASSPSAHQHDNSMANTPSSPNTAAMDTPTTATSSSSSRRPSLRTMPATIPRSALQEETIALFKQFRNLIPCAKCFCRNTIQRDGMSDGNLRFKCRPPVSMSLICNKSYSESKIRNMIAGVVYGHSLPDSGTPTSASGENNPGLAPPTTKSRRGSKVKANIASSPNIGTEKTPELTAGSSAAAAGLKIEQQQQDDEDMDRSPSGGQMLEEEDELDDSNPLAMDLGMLEGLGGHELLLPQPTLMRRPSQGKISRRPSVQQLRRKSLAAEDAMMTSSHMDYEHNNAQLPPMNQSSTSGHHLQVPGTPPLDGEDSRSYRQQQRPGFGPPARSVTPTGPPSYAPQGPPPSSASRQKLHHSHSHPNIGQQRHQQYLEQQEYQREQRDHRGSIGYPSHSALQQQQRQQLQRHISHRESAQQLGAPTERRSSQSYASSLQHQPSSSSSMSMSSPIPSSQKVLLGPGNEAHSPALSASPRSSPGREIAHPHQQQPPQHGSAGTPPLRSLAGAGRFEEGPGYFQRRMSQPHTGYGSYMSTSSSSGLPPMPSPLSHPYDRRASEIEEYPQMHREKYERLNASTLLAPGSSSSSRPHQKLRAIQPAPPSLPHHSQGTNPSQGRHPSFRGDISPQHPLDPVDPYDEPSRQVMTPPTRYSQPAHLQQQGGNGSTTSSQMSSPWISHGGQLSLSTSQSEPMRYSHSLPQSRPGVRHQGSSSSLYYHTSSSRMDDRDQYDSEQGGDSNREMSPEYQEMDSDGRPVIRTNNGAKRKSIGHALSRASSHQNLYMTRSEHQHQQPEYNNGNGQRVYRSIAPMDSSSNLDRAMPSKSAIKLTCFPNTSHSPSMTHSLPPLPSSQHSLDSTEAMSLRLGQTSKLVIEITQPQFLQSYEATPATKNNIKSVHRAASQPNLKRTPIHQAMGSTSPSFTTRRSASPYDSMDVEGGAASKKRRSDDSGASPSRRNSDESNKDTSTMAEAAAAALSAAANAATHDNGALPSTAAILSTTSNSAIQVFGIDFLNKKDIGLGLLTTPNASSLTMSSPAIEALKVAQASSFVTVEDQKELGIDYSLFTRVETAGWRILIPPNVIASFRSEDFGLMLKPKGLDLEALASQQQEKETTVVPKQEHKSVHREEMVDELEDDEEDEIEEEITFGAGGSAGHHGLGLKSGGGATSSTTTMGCSSSVNSLSSLAATTANDYDDEEEDDEDCKEDKIEDEDEDIEADRAEGLRRDDDEDVNVAGVSRIALGDREDQQQQLLQRKIQQTAYHPFQQQVQQEDVEMEMEQDELVEDD